MMYILYEQETAKEKPSSKGKEFSSHEEANAYIKEQFEWIKKSEVEKLIEYLNSKLAVQRFNADALNQWKDRESVKSEALGYLKTLEFYTTDTEDDFVMQYKYISNRITLNFAWCKSLEYDHRGNLKRILYRYSESEMRLILYHELLHATWLYTDRNNILNEKFPLNELKNNIKDNYEVVTDERYLSSPNEIYPRLKIIQNFLVNKEIKLTAENLYMYFYQLRRLRNSWEYPTQELNNYFSEPLDSGHKRLIYETFIIGLNMNFEEKNKKSEIERLGRLMELLSGLVSVDGDNNIMISTA